MGDISSIKPWEFQDFTRELRESGMECYNSLKTARDTINNLNDTWQSKSHKELINNFVNQAIESMNASLEVIVNTIPIQIGRAGSDFYLALTGGGFPVYSEESVKIEEITSNEADTKLKFNSTEATTALETVKSNYTQATEAMDSAKQVIENSQEIWQSTGADGTRTDLMAACDKISEGIETIKSNLESSMNTMIENLKMADNSASLEGTTSDDIIIDSDIEQMANVAQELKNKGQECYEKLCVIYNTLADLHNNWTGADYNNLIKTGYNEGCVELMNNVLKYIYTMIPYWYDSVAHKYSDAQGGTIISSTALSEGDVHTMTKLDVPTDSVLKMTQSVVSSGISSIENAISESTEIIQEVYDKFNGDESWTSTSKTNSVETLGTIIREAKEALNNLSSTMKTSMQKSAQSIAALEARYSTSQSSSSGSTYSGTGGSTYSGTGASSYSGTAASSGASTAASTGGSTNTNTSTNSKTISWKMNDGNGKTYQYNTTNRNVRVDVTDPGMNVRTATTTNTSSSADFIAAKNNIKNRRN